MTDPSKSSKEHDELMQALELPHALMGGTKAMRDAGTKFLPQEKNESDDDYKAKLDRSFLFGGYERTISILGGEVFDKPVTFQEDTPEGVTNLMDNIDLLNRNVTRFARDFFEWAIINGTGHIFVDVQPLPKDKMGNEEKTTKEQDKKLGRRPYFVHVPAGNLIGFKLDSNKNLTQIRLREIVKEDDGDFQTKDVEQIRVVYPGRWEVWRENDKKEWEIHGSGTTPLKKILLATLFTGKKVSEFTARPPLTGLAELNQHHWVSSSDQNNILHACRVPILFGKLLDADDDGKIIISPNNLIHSQAEDGDLKYVEHAGKAIGDGWKDLDRIEALMSLWGLDLIMNDRSGVITATERALTGAKTGSFLNATAMECQDVLNTAIGFMCEILGEKPKGGAVVNTDFSLALQNFDTNVLITAFKARGIDRGTLITELKRRGVIGENADPVEIAAAIANEGGSFGDIGKSFLTGTGGM
ncbi:MAG TPA: hypothetical protein DHV36_12385 [Desulfobacteraceae bacterium]|nr:hypothetical protein [Desulfobacteraceae bacterium]|tara:strand:+ start:2894 stop:4306 length:1413 start_codon:yes stop_codon:yes gene_type:complete